MACSQTRSVFVIGALAYMLALLGCQAALDDSPRSGHAIQVDAESQHCLESALITMQNYYSGRATPKEVTEAWNCADEALSLFSDFTRGSSAHAYSAQELRVFTEVYLLHSSLRISDGLLREVMRLKQALLGGTIDELSRAEIARARQVFAILRNESLRLLPHIRLLKTDVSTERVRSQPRIIDGALTDFLQSLKVVAAVRGDPVRLLLPSALAGGLMLIVADLLARLTPTEQELKLGVFTALVGAPLFALIAWRAAREWRR